MKNKKEQDKETGNGRKEDKRAKRMIEDGLERAWKERE